MEQPQSCNYTDERLDCNSSNNPLNGYVSSHWKSLRDGLDTSNHYILLRGCYIRFSLLLSTYCPLMQYGLHRNWIILTVVSIYSRAVKFTTYSRCFPLVSWVNWQILAFASIYCKCRYLIACAHYESLQTCYRLQAFKLSFRQFTNPLYYSTTKRRVWDSNPRAQNYGQLHFECSSL